MDYYLRAPDQAALFAALESAGILDAEQMVCEGYALDVIGAIYQPTGEVVQIEDGEIPEMVAVDGYHANLRTREELAHEQVGKLPLIDAPATPYRVWA